LALGLTFLLEGHVQNARYLTTAVAMLQSESRAQDQDVALAGS
jgi:hypothetical protein